MVKRHKRSLTLAALVLLLAQVFLMTFCNITAIAVTKEESSGSLFDNEFGNASVSYEETSTERLKWTVHLTKATQETATRFMVELTGDGQAVTPENVQVLTKSNPTMSFAAGNGAGQITAGMSETAATTTGSAVITFDTNRSYTAMTVKPKLIADVNPATDLLAGNTGKSFTIPQVATSESTSENSAVAASEAPVSESSVTEATSSTEVAVSDATSSTEQEVTTDSTEATEEADVEDEVVLNDSFSAQDIQPTASDYTSLKFNKTWDFGDVDPTSLTEEEKTIEIQVMRRIKMKAPNTNPWEEYSTTDTGEPEKLIYPDSELEWHMLPAEENGDEYEYTAVEKNSPYYEITSNVETPSSIESIDTVQTNSSTEWHQTNPSYIVTRNTDKTWLIWTADHVSKTDRQAFAEAIVRFGVGSKQPYKDFASLGNYDDNPNIVWVEGDVDELGIKITVDESENDVQVTLDFSATKVWTHFMYGTHSTKRVDVTNKYIPQLKLRIQKEWQDDDKYKDYTRQDIQLVLQQKIGSAAWKDYEIFDLTTDLEDLFKDYKVPSKVYVTNDAGEQVAEDAQYQLIERLPGSNPEQNRVPGYADPTYSSESTSETGTTLTVTNKLLTRDFSFTKVGNDGSTPLPDVSFTLTGDNGYTSGEKPVESATDGTVNFSELPIGNYTLTEIGTVDGYQLGGPWNFEVKDENGELVIVWQDGTKPSDIKIVNTLKPFDLTVHKQDDLGNALKGAEFTLTGPEGFVTQVLPNEKDPDSRSEFTFTDLAPGTYTLTETKEPDGYAKLTESITITIDKDGAVTVTGANATNITSDLTAKGNNTISFDVKNKKKVPLPSTGGPGTLLFTLIGMVTLGAAGMYVFFRKDQEVA